MFAQKYAKGRNARLPKNDFAILAFIVDTDMRMVDEHV